MSTLDRFLDLLNLRVSLDAYCTLCAPYALPHEALQAGNMYFHMVLSGGCTLKTRSGSVQRLEAGDFYLLTNGEAHVMVDGVDGDVPDDEVVGFDGLWYGCQLETRPDMEMICGYFHADNPASFALLQQFPQPLCVSLRDCAELSALSSLLRREAMAQGAGSVRVIHHVCEVFLLLALRAAGSMKWESGVLALLGDAALERVLAHVLTDISRPYSTDELAAVACLSRATFARRFQKAIGGGVQGLLRTLRMMEAAHLLKSTTLTVSQIAQRCGYQSDTAFHDNFRSQFGQTPARFRRGEDLFELHN